MTLVLLPPNQLTHPPCAHYLPMSTAWYTL